MKAKYNLAKRVNPSTKEKMWYAVPASKGVMDRYIAPILP